MISSHGHSSLNASLRPSVTLVMLRLPSASLLGGMNEGGGGALDAFKLLKNL